MVNKVERCAADMDLKQFLTQFESKSSSFLNRPASLFPGTMAEASNLALDAMSEGPGIGLSLRREIEPSSVHAVLDLNNPEVGVKGDFPFEPRLGLVGIDQWSRVRPGKHSVDAARRLSCDRLRRRSIERRASVRDDRL